MKAHFHSAVLMCAAAALTFTFASSALAKGGAKPCPFQRTPGEYYRAAFDLEPLDAAPARARGSARLYWKDFATLTPALQIEAKGLAPGDYVVNGIGPGGGFTTTVTVADSGRGGQKLRSTIVFDPPLIVDPTAVTRILVSSNGIPLLIGDLTVAGKSSAELRSTVNLTPGAGAPGACGSATWKRQYRNGQRTDWIWLGASELPPNAEFFIVIDGTAVGTAKSNRRGMVTLTSTVSDLTGMGMLQLLDADGAEMLRVNP